MFNYKFFIISLGFSYVVFGSSVDVKQRDAPIADKAEENLSRVKRVLPFLKGSGNGYIVAVAMPIALSDRRVFQAFNFEVHYSLADNDTFSPTELKTRWEGKRSIDDSVTQTSVDEPPKKFAKDDGSLFSRKNVYRIMESNLFKFGFNGTACLLKTICETSGARVYENNGIFGNIFHIIFTPSSSTDENIPEYFYEAEDMGHSGNCNTFNRYCSKSLLELATMTMLSKIK